MDKQPSLVHSFIVKLWMEEFGDEFTKGIWRGHITHVPDGERRYLKRLTDIDDFIRQYGIELKLDRGLTSRFVQWLRGWTRY